MEQQRIGRVYVGIDIHRLQHSVSILTEGFLKESKSDWRKVGSFRIENDIKSYRELESAIIKEAADVNDVLVAIDHTGGHYCEPLVFFLAGKGYHIYHLESKAVKAARERLLDEESKSDHLDAACAAYLLYLSDLHNISLRIPRIEPALRRDSDILNHLILQREIYKKLINQCTNRLHQLLLAIFPEGERRNFGSLLRVIPHYPTPFDIVQSDNLKGVKYLRQGYREELVQLANNTVGAPCVIYRDLILDLSQQRCEYIEKRSGIERLVENQVDKHPYGEILRSFPFISHITAATIISVIKDIGRWPNKKTLKKAMGIYAITKQSGSSVASRRWGREGNRRARCALYLVALCMMGFKGGDNDFKNYYTRRVASGKPKKQALFATAGKITEIIYHCLKNCEKYSYQGK
ncbi:transposase [Chloroflexota bacterium]